MSDPMGDLEELINGAGRGSASAKKLLADLAEQVGPAASATRARAMARAAELVGPAAEATAALGPTVSLGGSVGGTAAKAGGRLGRALGVGGKVVGGALKTLGPLALLAMVVPEIYHRASNAGNKERLTHNLGTWDALGNGSDENQLLRELEDEQDMGASDLRSEFKRQTGRTNTQADDIGKLLASQTEQLRAAQPYAAREGPSLMEIYAAQGLLS